MQQPAILYHDENLVAVDKPPFWLSVPASHPTPVLDIRTWLNQRHSLSALPLHRLDVETSGLLLFALNRSTQIHLSQAWTQHRIQKKYLVLAQGHPEQSLFKVKKEIAGKAATTQFEVTHTFTRGFKAWALPLTGRRHQIRIHLAEQNHPVLFDRQYGQAPDTIAMEFRPRVALHAFALRLPDGRAFECPVPADFQAFEKVLQ